VSSHAHATHASLHFHHVIVKCFTNLGVFLAVHKECSLKIFVLVLLSSCKEDLVHRFCLLNHHFNDHLHLSFLSCWLFGGHGGLSFLHSFDLDLRRCFQVLKSFFFWTALEARHPSWGLQVYLAARPSLVVHIGGAATSPSDVLRKLARRGLPRQLLI